MMPPRGVLLLLSEDGEDVGGGAGAEEDEEEAELVELDEDASVLEDNSELEEASTVRYFVEYRVDITSLMLDFVPVTTICTVKSWLGSGLVVTTVVAKSDFPQPYCL